MTKTTACLLTGVGRSAIAVIRIVGPDAMQVVEACFRPAANAAMREGQIRFGAWNGDVTKSVGQEHPAAPTGGIRKLDSGVHAMTAESVVVTPISRDCIEVHCHGGTAAVDRLLSDLHDLGIPTSSDPVVSFQTSSRLILEAERVLIGCTTPRTAAIAYDQVGGAMLDWALRLLRGLRTQEITPQEAADQARSLLRFAALGERLDRPFRVVLLGPPNVGKSSLMNAIVGYDRSITFDQAGTTRDVLHAETVIDGWPVILSDTAGLRHSDEPIEKEGVTRARAEAGRADLLLRVFEPSNSSDPQPRETVEADALAEEIPELRILNKTDLVSEPLQTRTLPSQVGQKLHAQFDHATCAISGDGVGPLLQMISSQLCPVGPERGQPVPLCLRQSDALGELADAADFDSAVAALHRLMADEPNSTRQEPK